MLIVYTHAQTDALLQFQHVVYLLKARETERKTPRSPLLPYIYIHPPTQLLLPLPSRVLKGRRGCRRREGLCIPRDCAARAGMNERHLGSISRRRVHVAYTTS